MASAECIALSAVIATANSTAERVLAHRQQEKYCDHCQNCCLSTGPTTADVPP